MNDQQLQRKLNQLAELCNVLQAEAEYRYGRHGMLFFEADGSFHIMDGDEYHDGAGATARQSHVKFSSQIHCRLGAGAW